MSSHAKGFSVSFANVRERIQTTGVVAIIRGDYGVDRLRQIAEALVLGGVDIMEITLNSTHALEAITELRETGGDEVIVGAGTVRTKRDVQQALDAGAQFMVSPNFDAESVTVSSSAGVLHLPGVFTGSEVQAAFAAGCSMVKLFPANALGVGYMNALRAPFNDVDFVPTGGITVENAGAYIRAGAVALGVGSTLVSGGNQDVSEITEQARQFINTIKDARNEKTR